MYVYHILVTAPGFAIHLGEGQKFQVTKGAPGRLDPIHQGSDLRHFWESSLVALAQDSPTLLWMVAKSASPHEMKAWSKVETRSVVAIYRGIEGFQGFLSGAGFRPHMTPT